MKAVGLFVVLLAISTNLASLVVCDRESVSTIPGMHTHKGDDLLQSVKIRKLKEKSEENDSHNIELDDYKPLDPVPSSKTSVRPGPIQHGTPLMPYIPKPSPHAPPASPPISPSP